jgi:hypothetical protein
MQRWHRTGQSIPYSSRPRFCSYNSTPSPGGGFLRLTDGACVLHGLFCLAQAGSAGTSGPRKNANCVDGIHPAR